MRAPIGYVSLQEAARLVGQTITGGSIWRELADEDVWPLLWARWMDPIAIGDVLYTDPDLERVTTMIAEACEAGKLAAVYLEARGLLELGRNVWHQNPLLVRSYFVNGTIDQDLPLVDEKLRAVTDGRTARCTSEMFIRRDSLEQFIKALPRSPKGERRPRMRKADARLLARGYISTAGEKATQDGFESMMDRADKFYPRDQARVIFKEALGQPLRRGRRRLAR